MRENDDYRNKRSREIIIQNFLLRQKYSFKGMVASRKVFEKNYGSEIDRYDFLKMIMIEQF